MGLEHLAANAAARKAEEDFWSPCKKNRHGEPFITGNFILRGMGYCFLPLGTATLLICIFNPSAYVLDFDPSHFPAFMTGISVFLIFFSLWFLRRKTTLEKDALVVRRLFSKRRISLDELRMAAMQSSPKAVRAGCVCFATETKSIRLMYESTKGGLSFLKILCKRINVPLPEELSRLHPQNKITWKR